MIGFSEFLGECRNGKTEQELTEELHALAGAVAVTGKAGTLTLTVKLTPNGHGAAFVDTDIKSKTPQPTPESTLFYVDDKYNLSRRDPRQLSLADLREVEETKR